MPNRNQKLDRRKFITIAGASLALPITAQAAGYCTGFNNQGIARCEIGVVLNTVRTARQQCPQWCWAAAIQTIFDYAGYNVSQTQIVERLYPDRRCATANSRQILQTIEGRWQDRNGRRFYASPVPVLDLQMGVWNPSAGSHVATALANGYPLISGAVGHATVLTAMSYLKDVYGKILVQSVTLRDPWPGRPNKRYLTPQEAYGTSFLAGIDIY